MDPIEEAITANQADPTEADATLPGAVDWGAEDGKGDDSFEALFQQMEEGDKPEESADVAEEETAEDTTEKPEATEEPETAEKEEAEEKPEATDKPEEVEEKEEPEEPTAPEPDLSFLREALPGAVIENLEDARSHVERLAESDRLLQGFEEIANEDEALLKYIALRKENKSPQIAAIEAFGSMAEVPDPDTDPEAYADWKAAEREKEIRAQYEKKEQTRQQQSVQNRAQEAQKVFNATVERLGLSDEQSQELATAYLRMTQGDQHTGKYPSDVFEKLWNSLQHDGLQKGVMDVVDRIEKEDIGYLKPQDGEPKMVTAVKEALRTAYSRGVRSVKEQSKKIDAPPSLSSSRSDPSPGNGEAKEMRDFAKETLATSNWWDRIPEN